MNPAIHAAISAALAADEARKKEEDHTMHYRPEDLAGDWEFKIVRSGSPIFRKLEILRQVREEESIAGWTLLEKLDDFRLRFKRPSKAARRDDQLPAGIDPYRTQIGGSAAVPILGLSIGLVVVVFVGLLIFSRLTPMDEPTPAFWLLVNSAVIFLILLVPIAVLFVYLRGRK